VPGVGAAFAAAHRLEPEAASTWEIGCVRLLIAEPARVDLVVAVVEVVWEPFPAWVPAAPLRALPRPPANPLEVDGVAVTALLLMLAVPVTGLVVGPRRLLPKGETAVAPLEGAMPALRLRLESVTLVLGVLPAGAKLMLVPPVGPSAAVIGLLLDPSWAEPAG
jgi:hypothetical protein